jgi:hypothetical protein
MTNYRIFKGRSASVLLPLAVAIAQAASAATITLAPVAGQRTNFPEGPQASVMFTIINNNADPMTMTSAAAAIANLVAGDGFDVASGAAVAPNQCANIAAFNVKTQTPGTCPITVTFNTTDTFTSDPETPGDIVTWNLQVSVVAQSLTHPTNTPQNAVSNLVVGVYDTSLPEPSTFWLMGIGLALLAAGRMAPHRR